MFQEAVFGSLGLSGVTLFLMRALVDMLSILIFLYAFFRNIVEARPFPISGIGYERFFILFLIYSIFISAISINSNLGANFAEILVLNRFVFIAITIPFIATSTQKVERLLKFLWIMVVLQIALGAIQAIGGPSVIEFFKPNDYNNLLAGSERSFTSNRGIDRRMLIGSLGDFISYGYILFFGLLLLISKAVNIKYSKVLTIFILAMIFLAGSRIVFLASLLTCLVYIYLRMRRRNKIVVVFLLIFLMPPALISMLELAAGVEFKYNSFLSLFKPEFVQALMNQRLGHLVLYLPELLKDPIVIVGLSPDKLLVETYAVEKHGDVLPYVLLATFSGTLEDFYPAALISYYGLIGSFLFYGMYYRIMRTAWADRSGSSLLATMSRSILLMGFAMHALSLGNQSFENRGLSLVFWVCIGLYSSLRMISMRSPKAVATTKSKVEG